MLRGAVPVVRPMVSCRPDSARSPVLRLAANPGTELAILLLSPADPGGRAEKMATEVSRDSGRASRPAEVEPYYPSIGLHVKPCRSTLSLPPEEIDAFVRASLIRILREHNL